MSEVRRSMELDNRAFVERLVRGNDVFVVVAARHLDARRVLAGRRLCLRCLGRLSLGLATVNENADNDSDDEQQTDCAEHDAKNNG